MRTNVLDHGYVELVESWGSDERIVEAARMSTDKGFEGWGPKTCAECVEGVYHDIPAGPLHEQYIQCPYCKGKYDAVPGDEKLLRYLWTHKHATPFEMAGMTIEVQAPIFVFREWHRHRTQSYNEMSARYTPLPDVNYLPTRERIIEGAKQSKNKQAAGTNPLLVEAIPDWLQAIAAAYVALERTYQTGLELGIPKELARICIPVGRYSRMRASANLRNWLAFMTLRAAPDAQWEIQQFAAAVGREIGSAFPRTWALFSETK